MEISVPLLIFIIIVIVAIFAILHISTRGAKLMAAAAEIGLAVAGGRGSHPTIHISGSSGAGKTTLGERIKAAFPAAHVYDVDEITEPIAKELMAKRHSEQYVAAHFIARVEETAKRLVSAKSQTAPVVLVGFMDWGNAYRTVTPKVAFDHKYFIDVPADDLLEQRWKRDVKERFCDRICNTKLDLATKPIIDVFYDPATITAHNATMRKQYKHLRYKFMSADEIFADVRRILK